jgi:hypothetical protein
MLIASSRDIEISNDPIYPEGFDINTGWGITRIGRLFEMLKEIGYKLDKYEFKDNINYYGFWDGHGIKRFVQGGYRNARVKGSAHNTLVRRIRSDYTLPEIYDLNYPLYIWGTRGDINELTGLSLDNPNYQHPYTQVTSGSGGNGLTDNMIHTSRNITLQTWQYKLYDTGLGSYVTTIPDTRELGFSISVFGVPKNITSVNSDSNSNSIYPNPVENSFTFDNRIKVGTKYKIFSIDGKIITEDIIKNNKINVSYLEKGIYLISLENENEVYKFIKN